MRTLTDIVWLLIMIGLASCSRDEATSPPAQGPRFSLTDFTTSQTCSTCHPQYYEEWKGSMHRYAANDPIWMLANNALQGSTQGRLQSWCWQCHAPIGFLTENTKPSFQFTDMQAIVSEGVNCNACHFLRQPHSTTNQHIQYNIQPGRNQYGTIGDPIGASVHENVYDASYGRSEVCRECHDLIVNNVPVEVTFSEWQNSAWGAMSVECQKCHMATYTGQAAVGGPVRTNLHRHDFVGVDVAMTDFPNKVVQRAAVDSLLKNSATVTVLAPSSSNIQDTIRVDVQIYNDRTGHNLPTSVFFFRQMWLEVTAWDALGTAYQSGHRDANGDLMDSHSALQPNADHDLALFGGILYKNGTESNVFELDSLVNNSIPPFATRTATYRFSVPRAGQWNLKVRLLFRPFGPYLFRGVGADQYLTEIPTFEMVSQQTIINVQ